MSTIPPYSDSLLGLVGATTPVGYNAFGGSVFVDHANNKLYFRETGTTTGAAGFKKIDGAVPGDELLQATETTIFGAGPAHTLQNVSGCYHPMGKIFASVDSGNSSPISKIDATTLVADEVVGLSNSTLAPAESTGGILLRMGASFQMIPLQRTGAHYLVSRNLTGVGAEREVAVLNVSVTGEMLLLSAVNVNEEVAGLCPGARGTSCPYATFFVVGRQFNYGSGDPTPAALYKHLVFGNSVASAHIYGSTNEAVSRTTVRASIAPADIDATWTNFSAVSDPGYDQADGNVLLMFSTLDSVTNTAYLVKFDAKTGDILWTLNLPDGAPDLDLPQSNINGILEFFTRELLGTSFVTRVGLTDGSTAMTTWNRGLVLDGAQVFDYLTGSITLGCAYSVSGTPVPTYIGDYLPANGDTIPSDRWGRIYTGAPWCPATPCETTCDCPDPDQIPVSPEFPPVRGVPWRRAWSFTLDGHTFYVLDLDVEGTFVYDTVTDQWAHFFTLGADPQWNLAAGTMWNETRIVGCDLHTGTVWELDPNAVKDNGNADEISHVAMGFLPSRSRVAQSCAAVRVTASFGLLDDIAGVNFNLRFSDDQGKTWSDYFTIALTEGDYSGEIAWRGLGSFAAPGRLFELSDAGGLVRIDGVDAFIDGFDNEGQQQ